MFVHQDPFPSNGNGATNGTSHHSNGTADGTAESIILDRNPEARELKQSYELAQSEYAEAVSNYWAKKSDAWTGLTKNLDGIDQMGLALAGLKGELAYLNKIPADRHTKDLEIDCTRATIEALDKAYMEAVADRIGGIASGLSHDANGAAKAQEHAGLSPSKAHEMISMIGSEARRVVQSIAEKKEKTSFLDIDKAEMLAFYTEHRPGLMEARFKAMGEIRPEIVKQAEIAAHDLSEQVKAASVVLTERKREWEPWQIKLNDKDTLLEYEQAPFPLKKEKPLAKGVSVAEAPALEKAEKGFIMKALEKPRTRIAIAGAIVALGALAYYGTRDKSKGDLSYTERLDQQNAAPPAQRGV